MQRTDPEARINRKSECEEAGLCYLGHALTEKRNGLVVVAYLTRADQPAERHPALAMIEPHANRTDHITVGADQGHDTEIDEFDAASSGEGQGYNPSLSHNQAYPLRLQYIS